MAKSPTDAFRAFGISIAACVALQCSIFASGSPLRVKLDRVLDFLLGLRVSGFFYVIFFWLAGTHAVQGLGIHSWQGFDIGFFVQATHNAFSEKALMFKNIDGDFSFFAHHFSPFLFLLAPLGAFTEAPVWLYLAQDAAIAATLAFLFGRIKNSEPGLRTPKLLMILILLVQPFWSGLKYYEFHELSFAPLYMFFLLEGWERKCVRTITIASLALLCTKETAFFSLAWFGLVLLAFEKQRNMRATGLVVLVLAVSSWILYFKLILPQIAGRSESMFSGYFGHLGQSMFEVALSPIQKPIEFLKAIFTTSNVAYLILMFGLCLPFLDRVRAWVWLVPVMPDFAVALLSRYDGIRNPGHQYAGLVVVPVAFVAISGLSNWSQWSVRRQRLTVAWSLAMGLFSISTNPVKTFKELFWGPASARASRPFVAQLRAVPSSEPIAVTADTLLPFVAQRDNLIWIANAKEKSQVPPQAQWLAFDTQRSPNLSEQCVTQVGEWQNFRLCRLKAESASF